jgi:hypothetical protein
MANTAAHLVDRVLPNLPIRQWVLSLPFDLRVLAAKSPEVVSAIDRILFREVERWMRHRAGQSSGRAGAVTFVQRFGGSLNLHVHFHVLFVEGLFTRDAGALPRFHRSSAPRRSICSRSSHAYATRCGAGSREPAVGPDDDVSRERLVRYCARPPFALERLSILSDGRIAYAIKQSRKGATHRILEPVEVLARIAALIPPPRRPFLRYHGVLAPNWKWRNQIVPRADVACAPRTHLHAPVLIADPPQRPDPSREDSPSQSSTPSSASSGHATFAVITPAHRARLDDGVMLATSPRIDWARLLRRTFAIDVLVCPRCRGPARVLAVIDDEHEARRLANALGEGPRPTQIYPAILQEDRHQLDHPSQDDDFERPPDSTESELGDVQDLADDD